MVVTLRALETAVPPTILVQDEVREVFATQPDLSRLAQRLVSTSFSVSGIDTRHTVIEELTLAAVPSAMMIRIVPSATAIGNVPA